MLLCGGTGVVPSRSRAAVPLDCEDCWLDKLRFKALFVVLVGGEDEPGIRVRIASTIAGMLCLSKRGWTLHFFGGGVVIEALSTLLSPQRVCLHFPWFLVGPAVCLFFLHSGIAHTWTTEFLQNGSWHGCIRCTKTFLHLSIHVLHANILINTCHKHINILQ